jgi:hypothetical protein
LEEEAVQEEVSMMYVVTWKRGSKTVKQMIRSKRMAEDFADFARSKGRENVSVRKWKKPPKSKGRYGPYKKRSNADDKIAELKTAGYVAKIRSTASGFYVYYRRMNL